MIAAYSAKFTLVFLLVSLLSNGARAQHAWDTLQYLTPEVCIPEVDIIADPTGLKQRTPGSVSIITNKEIQRINPLSGNEIFRRSPGIHVVDEEGAGLRTNISIRGLDPDRSRNVLILEDGIPVSLNPYGEPEMYYTPSIDRMERVEILKGSGQILFGPQTVGGVINYVTAEPSLDPITRLRFRGGFGGFLSSQVSHTQTRENIGISLNYLNKRADKLGYIGFNLNDFNAKLRFKLSEKAYLSVKMSAYDEQSNATYIGLTQTMFDTGNQDFTLMAPDDRLSIRRYALSAVHHYTFNKNLQLKTTAYGYTTKRNWARQDFSMNNSHNNPPANFTGIAWGDTAETGGAVFMRNSNGHRNRQFEVAGIESRVSWQHKTFGLQHRLDGGLRVHHERANEQLLFGKKSGALSGDMIENEVRSGLAFSLFAQNRIDFGKKISITPGLRLEQFSFQRDIRRARFNGLVTDTSLLTQDHVTQLIPGLGMNWNINANNTFFAGIHRGFAPPRVKDAIDGGGHSQNVEPELSWNLELGLRSNFNQYLELELTAFRMDFSNQIIPVSQSAGGSGTGVMNGGRTLHQGIEFGGVMDFGKLLKKTYKLELQVQGTLLDAHFANNRFIDNNGEVLNISGNRTPYSPSSMASAAITFETEKGLGLRLMAQHIGKQYTDLLNQETPTANGRNGALSDYTLLDAAINYVWRKHVCFSLSAKNLLNERYIVSRRPQGIRVGLPLFVMGGIDLKF